MKLEYDCKRRQFRNFKGLEFGLRIKPQKRDNT